MPRRFELRHRIGLIVVLGGVGLIAVTAVTLVLGRRSEAQVAGIATRYVPLIELDRDLDALVTEIPRALGDAVAAADESRLAAADQLAEQFVARLRDGRDAIAANGGDALALEADLRAYMAIARRVSTGMIAETPAADLPAQMEVMRAAQLDLGAHLARGTRPDRRQLAAAFATAHASLSQALTIEVVVALGVLVLMALLSWQFSRQTVRSLRAVSRGVERLAEDELDYPIEVSSHDELGDLAREANRTASRLRAYRERSDALLAETQRQAEDLARASRYKSEFLATMSHELRTPLNSILLLSQLLAANESGTLTAKQIEYASVIRRAGEELLGLINEVLDLAKIEAGKQTLEVAPVVVRELADYVRRMFDPIAAERRLALAVELAPDAPAKIRTDWSRLTQIVKNLVSNAIKFTERGSVTLRIAARGADGIEIAVADTGIGIPADQLAWIFEAFAQADRGTSRTFGGTGLGLTIARQLAIRLGGELIVASVVDEGSTFTLVLPIAGPSGDADAPLRRATALPPPSAVAPVLRAPTVPPVLTEGSIRTRAALAGKTVLIVDDDMRSVYSLSSTLHAFAMVTIAATDGHEALDELAHRDDVDLVVMDVMMPGLDGNETARKIRAQPRFRDLPIVALTARSQAGEREACLAAGASEYLPKPVDVERLIEVIRKLLSARTAGDPT